MGLLQLPDVRHTLVDTGTTLLCISGYNGLPGPILPINLIHETARRSERGIMQLCQMLFHTKYASA